MNGKWINTIESIRARLAPTPDGCLVWTGYIAPCGYGQVSYQGKQQYVHRLLYEELVWPVGEGLELDHTCKVKACANQMHLEEVTHRENVLRGASPWAARARQTHCRNGHEFTDANTYRSKRGQRVCRRCCADWQMQRRQAQRGTANV